jgi:hypothetical protein
LIQISSISPIVEHRAKAAIQACSTNHRPGSTSAPQEYCGSAWLHEVKFDALRIQLYTHGQWIAIYTRSGADFARRLSRLRLRLAICRLDWSSSMVDWSPTTNRASLIFATALS